MKKHARSDEQLAHFRCASCSHWWSIGDAPRRPFWYCPWCGEKSGVGKISGKSGK